MKQTLHHSLLLNFFIVFLLTLSNPSSALAQSEVITLSHDNTRIRELLFSTNGKTLIVRSGDEVQVNTKGIVTSPSVHLWDMDTKRKTMSIADREFGRAACISHDGTLLAFREKNTINIMDMTTKKISSTIKFDDNKFYRPTGFCNDNHCVVVEQGAVSSVYSIVSERAAFVRNYSAPGNNHYITRDDKYAIETFADSFYIQDFKTGNDFHEFPLVEKGKPEEFRTLVISPENRFVATLSDNKVKMWDMNSHRLAHNFTILPKDNIFCFSIDGRYIIGGSDTLKIWELRNKREISTGIVGEGKFTCASLSPDGKYLASGDSRGNIRIWDFSDENMTALYFSKEIENEMKQMPPKKEFEKTEDFAKRRQKLTRSIFNKYLTQYTEKLTTENTIQEQWAQDDERRDEEKKNQIQTSRETIVFAIDSISPYNADKETFYIRLTSAKERYSKWEVVKVPLRDNAPCFKQRAATLVVQGIKQLSQDMKSYEIYNIKIKSNCSGKDKDYPFGPQRVYLDE